MGAFAPILITLLVIPLITVYFNSIGGDNPGNCKYDLLHIDKAQREFILTVLSANDGTLEGLPADSVIRKIGDELYTLANYEEGKLQSRLSNKNGNLSDAAGGSNSNKITPIESIPLDIEIGTMNAGPIVTAAVIDNHNEIV